jgi:hypothetical protein
MVEQDMANALVNQVRRERTQRELERLASALAAWFRERHQADFDGNEYLGFHETRLASLKAVFKGAIDELTCHVCRLDFGRDPGEVYEQCRDFDEAIVWLRRVWEYFQDKFAQRDDQKGRPGFGRLLRAADEVVWSCYHPVMRRATTAEPRLRMGPAPLAYVEPEYSPAAVPGDRPLPYTLRLGAGVKHADFMREFLRTLPVPVLRLPPWCVEDPWWLVYVAHEVGHHVLHELELQGHFRQGMRDAARAQKKLGVTEPDANYWGQWGEEVFADVFSLLMVGPWALWAIAEVERGTPAEMVRRRDDYPSPVIRLAVMRLAARRLGLDVSGMLAGLNLVRLARQDVLARRDWAVIKGAVRFALGPLPGNFGTLAELCALDPKVFRRPGGKVEAWAEQLPKGPYAERDPESARQAVSAALCAWSAVAALSNDQVRAAARTALATHTQESLIRCAPLGTRPAQKVADAQVGRDLIAQVLAAAQQRPDVGKREP